MDVPLVKPSGSHIERFDLTGMMKLLGQGGHSQVEQPFSEVLHAMKMA